MTAPLSNVVSVNTLGDVAPRNPSFVTLSTSDVSSTTVYADVIQVQWQSDDDKIIALLKQASQSPISRAPRSTVASPASSLATATPVQTVSLNPSTPTSSASSNTGLSAGARAGIGVGVALGVIVIAGIAAIAFLLLRRRRRRRQKPGMAEYKGTPFHEMEHNQTAMRAPQEMDAHPMQELPGSEMMVELNNESRDTEAVDVKKSWYRGSSSKGSTPITPSGVTPKSSNKYSRSSKTSTAQSPG